MRNLLLAIVTATIASTQLANAAATIPDYRARVNTGIARAAGAADDANASITREKAQVPLARFYETPARH